MKNLNGTNRIDSLLKQLSGPVLKSTTSLVHVPSLTEDITNTSSGKQKPVNKGGKKLTKSISKTSPPKKNTSISNERRRQPR